MKKLIVEILSESEIGKRGIRKWPVWEKGISRFPHTYEGDEECLILDGEVIIETGEDKTTVKAGDFVTFKDGLKCVWDIKKPIRKHYNFK